MIGFVLAMAMAAVPETAQGRWDMVSINGQAASGARVAISEDRVGGRACNSFGGPYAFEGDTLTVVAKDFLVGGGTCDDAARAKTEQRLFDALKSGAAVTVTADRLVLTSDGQAFEFRRAGDD